MQNNDRQTVSNNCDPSIFFGRMNLMYLITDKALNVDMPVISEIFAMLNGDASCSCSAALMIAFL